MRTPAPPKGTRDFYPEEMARREHIFHSWEGTCRRYGFEKFDAPVFEQLDLYTKKSGDEIEKQLYTFVDKGGRHLALRPELTPSLARMVAARGSSLRKPVRWYSIPRLFRYEKMQKGRLREFFQLNMDILGVAEVSADAEVIAGAIDTMRDLGLDNSDFAVHVSSRTLLEDLLIGVGAARDTLPAIFAALDKRHKMPEDGFSELLAKTLTDTALLERVLGVLSVDTLEATGDFAADSPARGQLRELLRMMETYGMADYVTFDIGIVRGLAYYTGIVFEILDKKRSIRAVAGGGRYDRLVSLYGGPDTPAVGFAAGDVVLGEILDAKGGTLPPPPRSPVFVVTFNRQENTGAIAMASHLRANGIACEFALKNTGVGKQMNLADAAGAQLVVFVGGDEEQAGQAKIREMKTGNESLVPSQEAAQKIRALLGPSTK